MKRLFLLIILFSITTQLIAKPQWCSSFYLNRAEQNICGTAILWQADNQVNDAYSQLRKVLSSFQRNALKKEQNNWLQDRNVQCVVSVEDCQQVYEERIADLKARFWKITGRDSVSPKNTVVVCNYQNKIRVVTLNYLVTGFQVPCQVIYEKPTEEPGYREILWQAKNQVGYCERKMDDFVRNRLEGEWGWHCSYEKQGMSSVPAYQTQPRIRTHCRNNENIIFNCQIKRKTLSVCASKQLNSDEGYLQYRFGRKGKIELAFPPTTYNSQQAFVYSKFFQSPTVNQQISFNNNGYHYEIYNRTNDESGDFTHIASGIAVTFPNGKQNYFLCDSTPTGTGLGILEGIIPEKGW